MLCLLGRVFEYFPDRHAFEFNRGYKSLFSHIGPEPNDIENRSLMETDRGRFLLGLQRTDFVFQ